MLKDHPDLLFQTRSGITPHVLWGVPFCEEFFGEKLNGWESSGRKLIYDLFRLVSSTRQDERNEAKNGVPKPLEAASPKLESLKPERIRKILEIAMQSEMLPVGAFVILAVARSLNALCDRKALTPAESAVWWTELAAVARDAGALSLEKEPLGRTLLAGELALTLVYEYKNSINHFLNESDSVSKPATNSENRLSESKQIEPDSLLSQAQSVLLESLSELLDGGGVPRTEHLPIFRMLVASWTRMRWLDLGLETSIFDSDALSNFEWAVRMLMYYTRPDGSQTFGHRENKTSFWCPELFIAALKVDSDRDDKKLAVTILPDLQTKDAAQLAQLAQSIPNASNDSPWGHSAVLQQDWKSRTGATAAWNGTSLNIEAINRKIPFFSGTWGFSGSWNGKTLQPTSAWKQIFWHSTTEADYLELELELSEGFTLQRSLLLAKKQRFMLLADALSGDGFQGKKVRSGDLRWESRLPLTPKAGAMENGEALERFLTCRGKIVGTFLPLALPEWVGLLKNGCGVTLDDGTLCTSMRTESSALFSPILVDLEPQRFHSALTWRQLTVGEKMKTAPDHTAVGFRIQIDDVQWLVFRALATACNRSVLGHNLNSETFVGTFKTDGNVETILEVERGD